MMKRFCQHCGAHVYWNGGAWRHVQSPLCAGAVRDVWLVPEDLSEDVLRVWGER